LPYIKRERAEQLTNNQTPFTPGELNYVITQTCVNYLTENYGEHPSYADRSEIIGALECAKLEFYRRNLADYEDEKRADSSNIDPYV